MPPVLGRLRSRRLHRLTAAEIAESDRLRAAVQRHALTVPELARAAQCAESAIRGWLDRQRHLAPREQEGLRLVYTTETGGP